jgi:hypothetical protein
VAIARDGGSAVFAAGGTHTLLNVTAWGEGSGSFGVRATTGAAIEVENSIARGHAKDLAADPATTTVTADCAQVTGCPAASMSANHSNFRTASPSVIDGGNNGFGAPRFADPTFEDFHLRRGSAAIDRGNFDFNSGSADRDGLYRWLGRAPDIGAYEYVPPGKPVRVAHDTTAPRLTGVSLTTNRFRVPGHGVALAASTPAGTTLRFTLSESADLVVLIRRPGADTPVVGALVRAYAPGSHGMKISGRVDDRVLRPGPYTMTVIGRDEAQNLSRSRKLGFTVVS